MLFNDLEMYVSDLLRGWCATRSVVASWILAVVVGMAMPSTTLAAAGLTGEWRRLEMADCSILSDCAPKEIERFAVGYAAYRQIMKTLLLGPAVKLPRSEVVLFRRDKTFRAYVPPSNRENFVLKAYSIEVDGMAITALCEDGDRREAMTSLIEFETIWMLRRVGAGVPIWVSQGAGQVLSTLFVDSKGQCVVGADASRFTSPLARNNFFAWDRFFSIYQDSLEYRGEKDPGVYHSQAWALMHWVLLAGEEGQARFVELAAQVKTRKAIAAVAEVMGLPEGEFTAAIKKHLRTTKEKRVPFDEAALRAAWRLLPVPEHEVRARLFDLLAAAGKPLEARAELAKAMQLAPDSVPVFEAKARQAIRDRELEAAAALYRRAIEAGSTNPQAYLFSARARLDGSSVGRTDYAGGGGNNVPLALADIRQALVLAPGHAEAYELMGRAFYLSPKLTREDIATLSEGIGPGRSRVLYYRALLHERLKLYDESLADLRAVVADLECPLSLRRDYERRMTTVLFAKDHAAVEALVKDKQFSAALARLTKAEAENPGSADNYRRLQQWASDQERVVLFNALKTRVEPLVAGEQYEEALGLIREQTAGTTNSALQGLCGRLREWVEEKQALQQLNTLYEAKDWAGFRARFQEFLDKHPASEALPSLRTMDQRAQKRLDRSGAVDR